MSATKQTKAARGSERRTARQAPRTAVPLSKRPIREVWVEYRKCEDDETRRREIRNFLMERFLPLVRYNAERIYTRLPDEVDIEDLMSAGLFGLMDAIDAFDLARNVKFETYCAPRIRGAILDELRAMDWVPRLVRHRSGKVESARQKFEMKNGRRPTQQELADYLQLAPDEFEKVDRDSKAVMTQSITRKFASADGGKELREIDVVREDDQTNPLREMQRRDLKDLITKGLSRAERLIVILYYYEGMTMKEIGATLDLSESRVSQMHSSILARLKAQMQHRSRELEPMA
jgi:RNA polymerase sigma factor for flagellar operon FliA